jgi:hypothetical protein
MEDILESLICSAALFGARARLLESSSLRAKGNACHVAAVQIDGKFNSIAHFLPSN